MTFEVEQIVYDSSEDSLGIIYTGEPTDEERAVIEEMMQAFAELIASEREKAEQYMALIMGESEEIH